MLITDFCCGNTPFSQDLIDYSRSGIYTLTSIQEYTEVRINEKNETFSNYFIFKLLEKCGFVQVHAEDRSDLYQQYCLAEIETAEKNRANPNSVNILQLFFIFKNICILFLHLEINSSRIR